MENNTHQTLSKRLLSLDVLRGFDLACLVLLQPVIMNFLSVLKPHEGSFGCGVMNQLEHVPWDSFCCWDMIMPLFMFMSGITIPFAMSKYKRGEEVAGSKFFHRIFKRVLILWIVGAVVQGNLLDFDLHTLRLFSNTLQSIAVGYAVVAILYVFTSLSTQIVIVALCFLAYIAAFIFFGDIDFSIGTNLCERIDRAVLGRFQDGVTWNADFTAYTLGEWYHYTWILSSLNFIVTVYLGCLAGYILKSAKATPLIKFKRLMFWGFVLIIAALALSPLVPIIKHIWSSSMTLLTGGICFVLMGLFYYFIDIRGYTKGTGWLKVYGMNSLAAYFLGEHMASTFCGPVDVLLHGFQQFLGDYYSVLQRFGEAMLVYFFIWALYKCKVFIKA